MSHRLTTAAGNPAAAEEQRWFNRYTPVALLAAVLSSVLPHSTAEASCNLIPQAQRSFRGSLGATDRPFATPGDFVELSVRPAVCDAASPGFTTDPDDYVVTLIFRPPNNGPRRVVVLTTADCASPAIDAKVQACDLVGGVASVECIEVSSTSAPIGLTVVQRQGENRLAFRFPDTDALFTPDADDRTLSGPVTIAVNNVADASLPCGLATSSCASQSGLVACIDDLFTADGTCDPNVDAIFGRFTALPPPNVYQLDCFEESPPCNPLATELRMALDADGNLLVPFNWNGVILRPAGIPVPRLLRATLKSPLPFSIPSEAFVDSYTPEGGKLPPIFEPQFDPTVAASDVVTLFGSADAPATVLRIARHRGVCTGGSNNGEPCAVATDCGGGTCVDACAGGSNDGAPCDVHGDCPGGLCGDLYAANVFQLITGLGGPLTLERDATGINAICQQPPHQACSNTVPCPGVGNPCVRFSFQAQNPVPLEGLVGAQDIFSFVINEAIDLLDRNGDGDTVDQVVTLRSRVTGNSQALDATAGCGLSGTPEGRGVLPVFQDPFQYPAVAAENDVVAFLENEAMQNECDQNGNSSRSDPILRVFQLDTGELTAGLSPARVVDPAPFFGDRALALSNGLVFYRRPEARQAERTLERVSVATGGAQANDPSETPSISADGRYVAFASTATNLGGDTTGLQDIFVRDRELGTTEWISDPGGGFQSNAASGVPSISDDGRYVAFMSFATNLVAGDTNGKIDVFVRDRQMDTTERVSVATGGGQSFPPLFGASSPLISGNGRYVVFISDATDLVAGDVNGAPDIFIHDRQMTTTEIVSLPDDGTVTFNLVGISADGRYVAYDVGGFSGLGRVADRQNATFANAIIGADGSVVLGSLRAMSADGRFVTFEDNVGHLQLRDLLTETTVAVDYSTGGTLSGGCAGGSASISADGRLISFRCGVGVVEGFPGGVAGAFVHDRLSGVTEHVNGPLAGGFNNGNALDVAMASDGRSIAFADDSTNLVAGDTNAVADIFVASIDVDDPAADIFPDGNLTDTVLEVFDSNSSTATTLCPANDVVVSNGKAAFLRPESSFGTVECPGGPLNADGDTGDDVVQLWPGAGSVQNLGRAATAIDMSDTLLAALVSEAGQGGSPLNGDGDADDTVVQTYPVLGGAWQNVGQAADHVKICGSVVAFLTPEAAQGNVSLNFDFDLDDRVLQIFNPANGQVINTGQAADDFACSAFLIGLRTSEAAQGPTNLNVGGGDTDTDDYVLQVYDIGRPECIAAGAPANCVSNSRNAMRTCRLAACDPRIPYRVGADETTFIAYECDDGGAVTNGCPAGGTDHNGDIPPFAGDIVIRSYNVRTNTTRTLGRISGGTAGPNGGVTGSGDPLAGGDSPDGTSDDGGILYETVGRCIETIGGVCSTDADCAAGEFCDASTCKREQRVCVSDADCTGGVTCETSNNAGIVPASPDTDGDGVPDHLDNCIYVANAAQTDADQDRTGDLCDLDVCGNGILNAGEQCDGMAGACPGSCQSNCACAPPTATPTRTPTRTPTFGGPPLPPTLTPTLPPATATSTPTAPLTCGNNILEGVEQCDGTADLSCPGGCLSNCTCAVCGDEVANGTEQCDGADDNACPDGCDGSCQCTGSVCGDGIVDEDEDCDTGDDFACPGQCDSECLCPEPDTFYDSIVVPHSALKVVIGEGKTEVTKTLKVKVLNGDSPLDEPGPHDIQLIALDGTCPAGTVLGVDFDGKTPGFQNSIGLEPFKSKGGSVTLRFQSAAFTTHNFTAPSRCALSFRVLTAGSINEDPQPTNDRVRIDVNVIDKNDVPQSTTATTHESVLKTQKATNIIIPVDLDDYKLKGATAKVVNADILPVPEALHVVNLDVDDNDCPPGTVTLLTPQPVSPMGGKSMAIKLLVRAHPDDFDSPSKKSPARCTAKLTATTLAPGNAEPDASNNVTDLVINVYDKGDFAE